MFAGGRDLIQHFSTNLGRKADVKLLHAVRGRQVISSPNTLRTSVTHISIGCHNGSGCSQTSTSSNVTRISRSRGSTA